MSPLVTAHLVCLGLWIADYVARAVRLQLFVAAVGERIRFYDSFTLNLFGETAATLTPWRMGGQPARVLAMVRHRVSLDAALVAMALEALATYAVVLMVGVVLLFVFAPGWWGSLTGTLLARGPEAATWALVALLVLALVIWYVRGLLSASAPEAEPLEAVLPRRVRMRARLRHLWELMRAVPAGVLLLSIPLSIVNTLGRVYVLVALAMLLPSPPALGSMLLGSFGQLYVQLLLPTPGGAGVVEASFAAGASGDLGGGTLQIAFWWRVYTSLLAVALGALVGIPRYGLRPVVRAIRARFRRDPSAPLPQQEQP